MLDCTQIDHANNFLGCSSALLCPSYSLVPQVATWKMIRKKLRPGGRVIANLGNEQTAFEAFQEVFSGAQFYILHHSNIARKRNSLLLAHLPTKASLQILAQSESPLAEYTYRSRVLGVIPMISARSFHNPKCEHQSEHFDVPLWDDCDPCRSSCPWQALSWELVGTNWCNSRRLKQPDSCFPAIHCQTMVPIFRNWRIISAGIATEVVMNDW